MSSTSVSGKFFICGEYGVLKQGPALLGLTQKKFHWFTGAAHSEMRVSDFHPESPAGKCFLKLSPEDKKKIEHDSFFDPFQGKGGFGASTAQWILLQKRLQAPFISDCFKAREEYLSLFVDAEGIPPSGVDVVAQMYGAISEEKCVFVHPKEQNVSSFPLPDYFQDLYIFSTTSQINRKIKTHEHLKNIKNLSPSFFETIQKHTHHALEWIHVKEKWFHALQLFTQELIQNQLVHPEVIQNMQEIQKLPGVEFVKGCGAGLSDVFIVWMQKNASPENLFQCAHHLQFEWIQKGISHEPY